MAVLSAVAAAQEGERAVQEQGQCVCMMCHAGGGAVDCRGNNGEDEGDGMTRMQWLAWHICHVHFPLEALCGASQEHQL